MLNKLLSPVASVGGLFTTAKPIGVALRDIIVMAGSVVTVLGIFGALTPEQTASLSKVLEDLSGQTPQLLTVAGGLIVAGMTTYRTLTKSSSDRAAAAAQRIDAEIPESSPVVIKTPTGQKDIKLPAEVALKE